MSQEPIVVVGAGQAGLQLVDSLRRGGFEGELVLVGDEPSLPYQRPPLSKQYMAGDMADERLLFRPRDYFEKQQVQIVTDKRVTSINTSLRTLSFEDSSERRYARLALTTGASVRKLPVPGADSEHVYYLRDLNDARRIKAELAMAKRRVIAIGGGFIGLEIAASARELGHEVTVVEALDRLMARAVAPVVSDYYLRLHQARGVTIHLNSTVKQIANDADSGLVVSLADGRTLSGDLVVIGIGSVPHSELAVEAGIACENGIVVDEYAQTSDPNVVAAGDCTMHSNAKLKVRHRLESVQNAVDQAKVAAATLLGEPKEYTQIPWFWSDQFESKLQMVGSSVGAARHVVRGSEDAGAFSVFYFDEQQLIGVESVNRPADHLVSRKLLALDVHVPDEMIKDVEQNLKSLL